MFKDGSDYMPAGLAVGKEKSFYCDIQGFCGIGTKNHLFRAGSMEKACQQETAFEDGLGSF